MKVKNLLLTFALLLGASSAWAENTLSVKDVNITPNGKTTFAIEANFDKADFVGYQLDIQLPAGVKVVAYANGFAGTDHGIADSNPSTNLYRAVVSSNKKNAIPSGKFSLLEVTIEGDETLTDGSILDAKVTAITFSDANNVGAAFDEVKFKVNVSNVLILDENNMAVPAATDDAVDIKVIRTIKANEWSTICLPFAMSATKWKAAFGDDAEIRAFKEYKKVGDAIKVCFDSKLEKAMVTCTPYIIKVSKDITEFTTNAKININEKNLKTVYSYDDEETGETVEAGYMQGTLKAGTVIPTDNFFLNNGKFWYSAGKTVSQAFRAYFWLAEKASSESRINIVFEDETTGIRNIGSDVNAETIYDLQGRAVENAGKGIFIKGGKKVVVK